MFDEMKKHLGENLVFIHPEERHKWIDPAGVPFISSCFIYVLGNRSNGGMNCPFGLKHVTTVTRDPRSAN